MKKLNKNTKQNETRVGIFSLCFFFFVIFFLLPLSCRRSYGPGPVGAKYKTEFNFSMAGFFFSIHLPPPPRFSLFVLDLFRTERTIQRRRPSHGIYKRLHDDVQRRAKKKTQLILTTFHLHPFPPTMQRRWSEERIGRYYLSLYPSASSKNPFPVGHRFNYFRNLDR